MTSPVSAAEAAREAEAISRDALKPVRDALAAGPFKRPMSMAEREAWATLRSTRRLIVETVKMTRQSYFGSVWHVLEEQLDDYRSERDRAMSRIRAARYAHKRMEKFG